LEGSGAVSVLRGKWSCPELDLGVFFDDDWLQSCSTGLFTYSLLLELIHRFLKEVRKLCKNLTQECLLREKDHVI